MNFFWSVLWIPYLFILGHLYNSRSTRAYACGIVIVSGIALLRLPVTGSNEFYLMPAGIMWLLFIMLSRIVIRKEQYRKEDKIIWGAVVFYFLFLALSLTFGEVKFPRWYSYVYDLIDYSLLFFIVTDSVRTERDADIIVNSLIIAGLVMAIIGIGQFFFNDPSWGLLPGQSFDDRVIGFGSDYTAYGEKWRVQSTGSNPNSFGTVMIMVIPLVVYKAYSMGNLSFARFSGLILLVSSLLFALAITGARGAWIAGAVEAAVILVFLIFMKRVRIKHVAIILAGLALVTLFVAKNYYLSNLFFYRFETISTSEKFVSELKAGRLRKATLSLKENFDLSLFVIGKGDVTTEGINQPHNNYVGMFNTGGFWMLTAFVIITVRTVLRAFNGTKQLLGFCLFLSILGYLITGLAYENAVHLGPPIIFWPIVGILSGEGWHMISARLRGGRKSFALPVKYQRNSSGV